MTDPRKLVFAAALALATGAATAGAALADDVGGRLENQNDRIQEGVHNGSLTKGEAQRLRRQDARIKQERHRLASDGGGLSAKDKKVLRRDLDRESGRIHDERTDGQER